MCFCKNCLYKLDLLAEPNLFSLVLLRQQDKVYLSCVDLAALLANDGQLVQGWPPTEAN